MPYWRTSNFRIPMKTRRNAAPVAFHLLAVAAMASLLAAPDVVQADQPASPRIVHHQDVAYGRVHGAGLLADIAYIASKEPLPVMVSVHGGWWVAGSKRDGS